MNKRWVRILISLFVGGALQETVHVSSGKEIPSLVFFGTIITYVLLSAFVYYRNLILLQREVDKKMKKNDELIDDL